MNRARGNSLLETIMAIFLLTAACLLVVSLFHTALQRSRWSQQQSTARMIAGRTMAEVRHWSSLGNFLVPSDLSQWNNKTYPDPNQPEFVISIQARLAQITTPCSWLEVPYPAVERRTLDQSAARVQVSVRWSGGRGGTTQVSLVSLVPESPRTISSVSVTGSTGPLSAGAPTTFTAQALDSSNRPIKDVLFVWWVEAQTGNGQITASHKSDTATFVNQGRRNDGSTFTSVGTCRVAAMATYENKEVIGYSGDISLLP